MLMQKRRHFILLFISEFKMLNKNNMEWFIVAVSKRSK